MPTGKGGFYHRPGVGPGCVSGIYSLHNATGGGNGGAPAAKTVAFGLYWSQSALVDAAAGVLHGGAPEREELLWSPGSLSLSFLTKRRSEAAERHRFFIFHAGFAIAVSGTVHWSLGLAGLAAQGPSLCFFSEESVLVQWPTHNIFGLTRNY